jgi:acyl-CoA reductase-like NAD-dependent aldehyde dehydrogenase
MSRLPIPAHVSHVSRKDARDAVIAARAAFPLWSGTTPYNRGQSLYRIAELLETRRPQFVSEIMQSERVKKGTAERQVNEAIDLWIWYTGWADKYAQMTSNTNPVNGPYLNLSTPEPTGVVAIIPPHDSSLLGIVSAVAPALVSGNTVIVVASEKFPLVAVSFSEVLRISDLPAGCVNMLTGFPAELAPWLASHHDVDALNLMGAGNLDWIDLHSAATETLKQVQLPENGSNALTRSLGRITIFTETKTVWHTRSLL